MWQATWRLKDVYGRQWGQVDPKQSQSQDVARNVCVCLHGRRSRTGKVSFISDCISMCCCCSVAKSCLTLCDPMDCSMPGSSVLHYLSEFAQTQVHWVDNAIQTSHPLSSPFPPAFNLSQPQGLFQWVSSWHQVAKVLELQLQNQAFQWILISFRIDWFDLLAVQGTLKSLRQHNSSKASILQHSAFFIVQLSHPYMTTGKTIALTRWTFVGKVMSPLFNMLSRLVITFFQGVSNIHVSTLFSQF